MFPNTLECYRTLTSGFPKTHEDYRSLFILSNKLTKRSPNRIYNVHVYKYVFN
jgi:hypothetical protein